jgi:hypothetical protein
MDIHQVANGWGVSTWTPGNPCYMPQMQLNLQDIANKFHKKNSTSLLLCPFKTVLSTANERWFWFSFHQFTIILVKLGMDTYILEIFLDRQTVVDLMVTHCLEYCQYLPLLNVNKVNNTLASDLSPEGWSQRRNFFKSVWHGSQRKCVLDLESSFSSHALTLEKAFLNNLTWKIQYQSIIAYWHSAVTHIVQVLSTWIPMNSHETLISGWTFPLCESIPYSKKDFQLMKNTTDLVSVFHRNTSSVDHASLQKFIHYVCFWRKAKQFNLQNMYVLSMKS